MPPLAALLIDVALTALWPIVGKEGTRRFSGILFVHAGLAVGLLSVLPWLAAKGRWRRIFDRELIGPLFLMGFFGSALSSCLMIVGLAYTTPANAAIMAQSEVIFSAALCAVLLRERVTAPQLAGSALVLLGTGLIVARDLTTPRWKGDLLILLTPWLFQLSHIFAKRLPADLDAVTLSGARLFYGTLGAIPFSLWVLAHGPRWSWSGGTAALLVAQGVGMCSLNNVLWYRAIRNMDLAKATTIMLSYPALTVLLSWGLGLEAPHWQQAVGLLLTLSGAYWVSLLVLRAEPGTSAAAPA